MGKHPEEVTSELRSEGGAETLRELWQQHSRRASSTRKSWRQERTWLLKGPRGALGPCLAVSTGAGAGRDVARDVDVSWSLGALWAKVGLCVRKPSRTPLGTFKAGV